MLDIAAWRRWLVLHLFILPFRPKASGEAYEKIWTERGSPLLFHSQDLAQKVQQRLGAQVSVDLAMRYGRPSIPEALARFRRAGIDRIVVFPLYPQYSSAATGSSIEKVFRQAAAEWNTPYLHVVPPFYDHPLFLDACARVARPVLDVTDPERVDLQFSRPSGAALHQERRERRALLEERPDCCDRMVEANRNCYRAQCFATARGLADLLRVPAEKRIVCFQSRLGRTPWIRPYTDEVVVRLAREGVKRAVILSPAFVADCLETIEELGMRAVKSFRESGGEVAPLVPAVNASDAWADARGDAFARGLRMAPVARRRAPCVTRPTCPRAASSSGAASPASAPRTASSSSAGSVAIPAPSGCSKRSDRLGGQIRTERVGEYLIEGGPDSLVAHKPRGGATRGTDRAGADLAPIGGRHAGTEIVRRRGDRSACPTDS